MLYRIIALIALFFFTACGGGPRELEQQRKSANIIFSTPEPSEQQPIVEQGIATGDAPLKIIKIGLLAPLTGPAASAGMALMDSATLALMDKYGYTETDNLKVKIVLVPKDTQGTPAGATAAAQAVLRSGAQLIVGPLFSQNVTAVAPIAKEYGVNVLTFSNNPEVAGNNVFVFGFQADQQVKRILNYALNQNLTKIALLAPNNAYGMSVQQSAKKLMETSGITLAQEQAYNPAGNASAEIAKLAAFNASAPLDAVLVPEGGQKLEVLVRGLGEQGISHPTMRFLGTGLWDEPSILSSSALVGGWFASSPPDRFASYERRFREYFGYAPPRISALAYDAMALAASLGMADATFSEAALTDPVGYNGPVNGIFRCHSNGICERGLAVLEVTGKGIAKVIDPAPRAF